MLKKRLQKLFNTSLRILPRKLNSASVTIQNNNDEKEIERKMSDITPKQYLQSNQGLSGLQEHIPSQFVKRKVTIDVLYLIDPYCAKKIASKISPILKKITNSVIAECAPGLGLLTKQLLLMCDRPIKLFEPSVEFRTNLKNLAATSHERIQLYSKNLLRLDAYSYLDGIDNRNRVKNLLKNIPKKGWTEDPAITVIGSLVNINFLKHLIASIVMQTSISNYGRTEMFFIMKPSNYLGLSIEHDLYVSNYNSTTVLFNLFFDYQLLCKLPREAFIPWDNIKKKNYFRKLSRIDTDKLYLVHMVTKKDLPLPFDQLVFFHYFIRKFFIRNARIVPTLEILVPGSGVHVMVPQLHHEDYFQYINIFTEFKELTPKQLLGVFREMYNHPNYPNSAFAEMVETVNNKPESIFSDSTPEQQNTFMDEIEQEFQIEEHFTEEDIND